MNLLLIPAREFTVYLPHLSYIEFPIIAVVSCLPYLNLTLRVKVAADVSSIIDKTLLFILNPIL